MDYNPLSPEVQANPFPTMPPRRDHPVACLDAFQCWTVSRYDDVDFAPAIRKYFPRPTGLTIDRRFESGTRCPDGD